jgi:hypothetical protein
MSEASEKLARSRMAIMEHVARKQRRHDPREEPPQQFAEGYAGEEPSDERYAWDDGGSGWFGHLKHAVRTWWHYHPANMAVELVAPMMRSYARRKPVQLLAISLAAGAALTFTRPWRLISITTLVIAVLKSSQLPRVLMAAMSAADYRKDADRPE